MQTQAFEIKNFWGKNTMSRTVNKSDSMAATMRLIFQVCIDKGFRGTLLLQDELKPAALCQYFATTGLQTSENNQRFPQRRRGNDEGRNEDTCEKCE